MLKEFNKIKIFSSSVAGYRIMHQNFLIVNIFLIYLYIIHNFTLLQYCAHYNQFMLDKFIELYTESYISNYVNFLSIVN